MFLLKKAHFSHLLIYMLFTFVLDHLFICLLLCLIICSWFKSSHLHYCLSLCSCKTSIGVVVVVHHLTLFIDQVNFKVYKHGFILTMHNTFTTFDLCCKTNAYHYYSYPSPIALQPWFLMNNICMLLATFSPLLCYFCGLFTLYESDLVKFWTSQNALAIFFEFFARIRFYEERRKRNTCSS
jgi:hypothetical protein